MIHSGEKPYKCEICKKTFSGSSDLAKHNRIHKGEKPFECEICSKAYHSSSILAIHTRVHTGEKPYSCDVCQKTFSRSTVLSRHNRTAAHIEIMKSKKTNIQLTQTSFLDCGEAIKIEDKRGEINYEESVEDPLSIHQETENSNICKDIKGEINKEESIDDPLSIQREKTIQRGEMISENENIITEVEEEVVDDDDLFVQEIDNSVYVENSTVVKYINIFEVKK
jgi:uncharacterized Zn-finger protein